MHETRWTAMLGMALLLTALPAVTGCGGSTKEERAEAMAEKGLSEVSGKKVDLDAGGKHVRIEGEGMKAAISETTEWPADIFSEVPEFTFGKVERVSKSVEGATKTFNVYLHEIEPGGVDRYAELLKQGGWTVNQMSLGEKGGMLNGQKPGLGLTFTHSDERRDGMLAVYTASE